MIGIGIAFLVGLIAGYVLRSSIARELQVIISDFKYELSKVTAKL